MARLQALMLCDYAQVREGLLVVVSAGVSRSWGSVPRKLNLYIAGLVEFQPDELDTLHELRLRVTYQPTHAAIAQGVVVAHPSSENLELGECPVLPLAMDFRDVPVEAYGLYDIHCSVDAGDPMILSFYVAELPPAAVPNAQPPAP